MPVEFRQSWDREDSSPLQPPDLLRRNPEGLSYFLDEHHVLLVGWSVSGSNAASSQTEDPTIAAIDVTEGVLRLDLVSPAARHKGTFWFELVTQKLRRSVVDSKEVFRSK